MVFDLRAVSELLAGNRRPLSLSVVTLVIAVAVTGCAQNVKQEEEEPKPGIYFVENKSVDLEVRKDFDAAVAHISAAEYDAAIELLNKVIESSQNNSAPYINLAIAYKRKGELEKAEEQLKKALEVNPDHPVANNEYALLYRETGRYEEARALYDRVVGKYPEYMPVRKNYGILCELYLNEPQCALEQYRAYLEANPKDEDVELWVTTLERKVGG